MVTSNKIPDKKVLKMTDHNNSTIVVPQRTLLGEVNEHITCPLCHGYYIDATTIVECLHSFCRSCIIKHLQVKSYCPVCEMMINSAKPNIKPDKALQDIVYKLVPGLFQREMERRQHFYSSRPGPAASATPEQRGEDTERIIFSPEDVISFSLEYVDVTDTDSISSKSSDSNEPQQTTATRRFLQCPAVVNVSHLKKFISMKFDIDSTQFAIDVLYKRVPLPDYYTLMDIAYIYNWKRNEPMRFFYQIIDYIAIRSRYGLFDINRNGSHFRDIKSSPTPTEETSASSPAPTLNEPLFEASSGTESPMLDDTNIKTINDAVKNLEKSNNTSKNIQSLTKKTDDDEKSQFLNSFELTAKSSASVSKSGNLELNKKGVPIINEQNKFDCPANKLKTPGQSSSRLDDSLKKKSAPLAEPPEPKKAKIEIKDNKLSIQSDQVKQLQQSSKNIESFQTTNKPNVQKPYTTSTKVIPASSQNLVNNPKPQQSNIKDIPDATPLKRPGTGTSQIITTSKQKFSESQTSQSPQTPKPPSPTKQTSVKSEPHKHATKSDVQKPNKKIPDLKPSVPQFTSNHKSPTVGKVRMDLLANNSDPTMDRSKILSQVKTSLMPHNPGSISGDPLKSLFDSCKINIPSSLSITLTDQKQEQRNSNEQLPTDNRKAIVNKNLSLNTGTTGSHKVPSPPVHNYIEILKLPESDSKKQQIRTDAQIKSNTNTKSEAGASQSKPFKQSESTAKGPIPSLKPISDSKHAKGSSNTNTSANFSGPSPITFQQTFEQQLQSEKTKLPKNKLQVPKLMPATPKAISAANKLNSAKTGSPENRNSSAKPDNVLDLSTPHHNIQSQLDPQQTKKFETMQSIANLAKKQNNMSSGKVISTSHNSIFPGISNRPVTTTNTPLKQTANIITNQIKMDRNSLNPQNVMRQEALSKNHVSKQHSTVPGIPSPTLLIGSHSTPLAQPSPRPQTRSPSSSPKLVIAEEKHTNEKHSEQNLNQSNQITSTQLSNNSVMKIESPSTSKQTVKPIKSNTSTSRLPTTSQVTQSIASIRTGLSENPTDFLSQPQLLSAQHAIIRHHMEMQNAWIKAQRQYDLYKNMSNVNHQTDNKDKQ